MKLDTTQSGLINLNVLELSFIKRISTSSSLAKFRSFLLCVLTVSVFSVPRTLQVIKISLLLLLLICFLLENRYRISYFVLIGVYSLLFFVPLAVALLLHNQFSFILNVLRINFFFPVMLLLVLQQFELYELRRILERGALISIVIILIIFLSSVLNAFNFFPYNINQFFYPDEAFVGIHEGYLHVVNSSLSYLVFVIPLYFFNEKFSLKNYKLYLFLIMLILAIVSGRRILLLPFILIVILNLKKVILPMLVVMFLAFLVVNKDIYAGISTETIFKRFQDAVNESGDSEVRGEQSRLLHEYTAKRPILGYGFGSYMPDYLRDPDRPYAYEKTWDYQFFSMGIPTAILHFIYYFVVGVLVLSKRFADMSDTRFRNALIVAVLSILVASSTNPYWLSSFDYCLPLAILIRFSQQLSQREKLQEIII